VLALLLLLLGLLVAGWTLRQEHLHQRDQARARLDSLAELRATQLEAWLAQWQAQARFLRTSQRLADQFRAWTDDGDQAAGERPLARMVEFRRANDGDGVLLMAADGRVLAHEQAAERQAAPALMQAVRAAVGTGMPAITSIDRRNGTEQMLRLDVVVPLAATGDPVLATVRPVQGSDWLLVAKQDLAEVDAPSWRFARVVGAAALPALLGVVLATTRHCPRPPRRRRCARPAIRCAVPVRWWGRQRCSSSCCTWSMRRMTVPTGPRCSPRNSLWPARWAPWSPTWRRPWRATPDRPGPESGLQCGRIPSAAPGRSTGDGKVRGMNPALVLAFDDEQGPAAALAQALGVPCALVGRHRFPDGESRLRLPPVLPADLLVYRGLQQPNHKLVELLIALPAARALGARRILLVAPYLAYMRQDMAFTPGEAVSQRHVAALLASQVDGLITVDPHLHRIASLDEVMPGCRSLALSAAPLLGAWVAQQVPGALLLGPDEEALQWVAAAGTAHGLDHAVCTKQRFGDRDVRVALPDVPLAGRAVVLLDDVASTGRTLVEAATAVQAAGAASVDVAVTHALFVGDALAQLRAAGVRHVWSSDAVPHASAVVPINALLASAVLAI